MSTPPSTQLSSPVALPDAPVEAAALLLPEERQLLLAAQAELGLCLSLFEPSHSPDAAARMILGPPPPAAVLAAQPEAEPLLIATPPGGYLCSALFHDGDRLVVIAAGPLAVDPSGAPAKAALSLGRHLCRVAEALLLAGLRRVLSSRIHVASVEDAFTELQQKNRRLEQAIERMHELDSIKANFLATVSHELRTPLTSVIGYSEMLMEGLAGPLNDDQREYLRTVMDKGEQLLGLITGILDISRIESTGVQLFPAPVRLPDLVAEVVTTVTPQARRKHIRLSAAVPAELPMLSADRDKLRQVLLNLVGNAIKFTPDGGQVSILGSMTGAGSVTGLGTVTGPGSTGPGGATGQGDHVLISVVDSGIGIPPHLREKVFDPFFQVDNSSTREYEGTGLGLSIVRKFIEAHGGRVWVAGHEPQGAVFHFSLPIHPPAPSPNSSSSPSSSPAPDAPPGPAPVASSDPSSSTGSTGTTGST